nr:hypothetical protein [Ophiocordyceps lanpingensis]
MLIYIYILLIYSPYYILSSKNQNLSPSVRIKSDRLRREYSNKYPDQFKNTTKLNTTGPGPAKDPNDEDDFVEKTVNNNNLITVCWRSMPPKHLFIAQHKLDIVNLKTTPISPIF